MRDEKIQQVAEMLIARRWGCASDFGDEPTETFVEWPPPARRRPAMRSARGTVPPEREVEHDYECEVQYELEHD